MTYYITVFPNLFYTTLILDFKNLTPHHQIKIKIAHKEVIAPRWETLYYVTKLNETSFQHRFLIIRMLQLVHTVKYIIVYYTYKN